MNRTEDEIIEEIIKENLRLPDLYKNKSVVAMVKHQEKLIKEFCALGNDRERFFELSRMMTEHHSPEQRDLLSRSVRL